MKFLFPVICAFLLMSCQSSKEEKEVAAIEDQPVEIKKNLNNQVVPADFIRLNDSPVLILSSYQLRRIEENHFGDFFGDRAIFYIIDNPENEMYSAKVNNIMLCFLDDQLAKTKYDLSKNIANQLIASHGKFKILWTDLYDKKLIMDKKIIIRNRDSIRINEQLRNYTMKWEKEDKLISYDVKTTDSTQTYTYIEMKNDYKTTFYDIQYAQ